MARHRLGLGAIDGIEVHLESPDLYEALSRSRIGRYEHAFLMYSGDEPGIVALLADVLDALDVLYWKAPGPRYLCGVIRAACVFEIAPADFAEYSGAATLKLRRL